MRRRATLFRAGLIVVFLLAAVLLFYGLHAHGTVGTARVLAPSYAKVLRQVRNLRHLNEFQMLVRVDVAKEEVFPHILAVFPIYDRGR